MTKILFFVLGFLALVPVQALAGEGTAGQTSAPDMLRAPVSDTNPSRTPATIGLGSIDTQGRLRVAARPGISTPSGPLAGTIATGGVAVTLFAAGTMSNVIDIINPPGAAEPLFVDFVATALAGAATSIPLVPGQWYRISGPISTAITAVAATAGHAFVAVSY